MKVVRQRSVVSCLRSILCVSLFFIFQFSIFNSAIAQTAIGHWRGCLDYSLVNHVVDAGDRIYAAALDGVFCYDLDDHTLTTFDKGDGLNDVGIATIGYDKATQCLVVAYNNSNVDLLIDGRTYNLSDIKRSEISGDKSIYHVRFSNGNAYLATGFGVVVVDVRRQEIKETWYLGAGGTYTPVYDLAFMPDSLFAATGEGLKRLSVSEQHPSVSDRWDIDHRLDSLNVAMLCPVAQQLLVAGYASNPDNCSLLVRRGSSYSLLRWGGVVNAMQASADKVAVCADGHVLVYDTLFTLIDDYNTYNWGTLEARDATFARGGVLWVAHPWEGIVGIHPSGEEEYHRPSGPANADNVYRLVPFNYRMMLCPGGHTPTYASAYLAPNVYTAVGQRWSSLDRSNGLLDGLSDLLDVAVNPRDTNESVAALWGHGVVSIRNNQVQTLYNSTNTEGALIPYSSGSYSRLNTGAVEFDLRGDLWILNSQSTHALAVRRADGTWKGFPTMSMVTTPEVDKLVCDSVTGYKWFCGRSNVIYVHDGVSHMAKVNPNNGSKLSTDAVTALVQDHNGNIWIGTNKGIKVIYDGYKAFNNGGNGEYAPVNCSNITITNGEFSEYLMAYESITAIAVDGANRKWVGTASGGLYLISANGLDQLEHFTASNSPLYSDKVVALGINERTGEVYIGTDRGLQVYRGTATYAVSSPLDKVYAFPNPVKPDYDGPIAIKGFTRNGLVHITDAAGHTVYTTTANGGQAIWDGRTASGEKVASGVYYVFASDSQGDNRSVAKILIIR